MKKFIEYLKNCWKVEDLRERILITILFVAIYRFGSFVVLPGINPSDLENLQSQTAGGLMSYAVARCRCTLFPEDAARR